MLAIIETAPVVLDIGLVLISAAAAGFFARRIGLPAVVGYLLVGLLVSPFTPGYVADHQQLSILADVGVVLLLFEVGIEVDLRRLSKEQGALLWAAPLQVLITTAIAATVLFQAGLDPLGALLLGTGIAMSSSVVIVNITRSRRRTTDPRTDETLLGWSVIQDVTGVLIAATVLALGGATDRPAGYAILGLLGFAVMAMLSARILTYLLRVVRWERDVFLILSVSTGLLLAAIGSLVFGVPMALAAFVAGLAVNDGGTDSQEVRRALLPFRDVFAVLFFVVIGSLVRPDALSGALPFAGLLLLLLVATKAFPIFLLARSAGATRPLQTAIGMSQLGEFSFVLGSAALANGVLSNQEFVGVLLTVIVSIIVSTVLVRLPHRTIG